MQFRTWRFTNLPKFTTMLVKGIARVAMVFKVTFMIREPKPVIA